MKNKAVFAFVALALMAGCAGVSQSVGPNGVEQRVGPFHQSVGPGGVQQGVGSAGPQQSVGPGGVYQGFGTPQSAGSSCSIDCAGRPHAVSCPSGTTPVCQCGHEPFAACMVAGRSSTGG